MKRVCLILVTFAVCLLSCSRGGRTIPADKLADIYADMLVLDQWARNNGAISRQADTSLVYEPVIRRHGYTVDEYIRTVEDYLHRPGDFAKVFEQVQQTLQARADHLTALVEQKEQAQKLRDSLAARTDFRRPRIFTIPDRPWIAVRIELDSANVYDWDLVRPDTLYDGVFLILPDSVQVDSVQVDSVRADSAGVADGLPAAGLKTAADTVAAPSVAKPLAGRVEHHMHRQEKELKEHETILSKISVPAE